VFLEHNGISIAQSSPALYDLTLGVAEGRVTKVGATEALRRIAQSH
jgi:prophage maintenance system killer protein